jgi:4'-phosphopantetheinyl transferase
VHFWWALVEDLNVQIAAAEALITDEELSRSRRFYFERGRREYLATRVLERTVLSRYGFVDPTEWRFRPTPHGRPEIVGPAKAPRLRHNLSNADGIVACVIATADFEVGVDVEDVSRPAPLEIADRFFAASEVQALRALLPETQTRRFFDYWTLKESYIKARGLGLTIPLEQFSFALDSSAPVRIAFDPGIADDPAWWEFCQIQPIGSYLAAVAVRRPPGARVNLVVRRIPLAMGSISSD